MARCAEFVELVTAGSLDPVTERRLVDHLLNCGGCEHYLQQFEQTIRSLGELPPHSLRTEDRDALIATFQDALR